MTIGILTAVEWGPAPFFLDASSRWQCGCSICIDVVWLDCIERMGCILLVSRAVQEGQ